MTAKIYAPRPYQLALREHYLGNERGGRWAGMGLGKTSVSLEAIDVLWRLGEIRRVLVLAPKRVALTTWPDEVAKWENFNHLSITPVVGTAEQRTKAARTRSIIHTINYENLPWLAEGWGEDWPYDMVIADESTKLKSFRLAGKTGRRARSMKKVAFRRTKYWSNLTGTPAPQGLIDLWGQNWFLDQGKRLGRTFTAFKQRWFMPDPSGYGIMPVKTADAEIHAAVSDVCLSMEAKDHFDLPDIVKSVVYVDLPPRARQLYEKMEREMFIELKGGEVEAFNAASKSMKCLQLANGAAYLEPDDGSDAKPWEVVHDAKLDALEDVIEEFAGKPLLVAYHFKSDLARILKRFPQARYLDDNPQTERDWSAGRIPLLIAHPQSAGHGLNLQDGGHIVVFFGDWWALEPYLQFIERVGPVRQIQSGYDRPTFLVHIVARNTVDELVLASHDSKKTVLHLLTEATKGAS